MLYIGLGIRHWIKPLVVGTAAGLALSKTCRKAARVMMAAAKGAIKSGYEEAMQPDRQPQPFSGADAQ